MPFNRIKLTENIENEISNKARDTKALDTEIIELTSSMPANTSDVLANKAQNNNVELIINVPNKSHDEGTIKQVVVLNNFTN